MLFSSATAVETAGIGMKAVSHPSARFENRASGLAGGYIAITTKFFGSIGRLQGILKTSLECHSEVIGL
ncbi:MAG: hypothetical protein ACFB0E_20880 [Leptolyngbyaceae cyanobacterium]